MSVRILRPSRWAKRRSARCMSWRPHVSGAESPIEPKVADPAGGAKAPRVSIKAGSSEKASGAPSQAPSYSNKMVSAPRARLQWARPTGRVCPPRSICTSKSVTTEPCRLSLQMDALSQLGSGKVLTDAVMAEIGGLRKSVEEAEGLEGTGIYANADAGITRFDPL